MPEEDYLHRSPVNFDEETYQTCYAYWQSLKGDRRSPSWREWDWMQLPLDLIPYFIVVDVHYDPLDFIYRFYGTASVTMHDKDFTGQSVSAIRSSAEQLAAVAQYTDVVSHHEALECRHTTLIGKTSLKIVQMSLRMPFSDDGETVTQIATYVDWGRDIERILEESERVGKRVS